MTHHHDRSIRSLPGQPLPPEELHPTEIADPQRLARGADAWPQQAAIGRLGQVCDRWIYSACLCFGLDLDEQEASGFRYAYSVYQAEYSRDLLFRSGAQMEAPFDRILD